MDVERTRALAWDVFRYAGLFDVDSLRLDPTDDNIAGNLAFVFMTLGDSYRQMGDMNAMVENYRKAAHLSRDPQLAAFIQSLQAQPLIPPAESGRADTARAGHRR